MLGRLRSYLGMKLILIVPRADEVTFSDADISLLL